MLWNFLIPVIPCALLLPLECPGDAAQVKTSAGQISGFFISENPVECTGTIVGWSFCYYTNIRTCTWETYEVRFGLYGKQGESFQLLSQTEGRVRDVRFSSTDTDGFTCDGLRVDLPYDIEQGYHIGVCLLGNEERTEHESCHRGEYPLPIIAKGVHGNNLKHSVFDSYCVDSLPNKIDTTDSFNTLENHALHVSLQVGESIISFSVF